LGAKGDHRSQIDLHARRRRDLASALELEDRTKRSRLLRELSQLNVVVERLARASILQKVLIDARVAKIVSQVVLIHARNERASRTLQEQLAHAERLGLVQQAMNPRTKLDYDELDLAIEN